MSPAASVVIPTFNRCDTLRQCLQSVLAQSLPVEVIVLDDASTDGTAAMLAAEFPTVIYRLVPGGPNGPCVLRNLGSEMASCEILFPLDDDSVLPSRHTIEQTLADFDHPRVGAVAIPYRNVNHADTREYQRPPETAGVWCAFAYTGASHAIRRSLFLGLGGYREELFYMGEEGDFSIRLLNAGYVVRFGRADTVHHLESPRRNVARLHRLGYRNNVLSSFYTVPMPQLLVHLAGVTMKGLRLGWRAGVFQYAVQGLWQGFAMIPRYRKRRAAVSLNTYQLMRYLKRATPVRLEEIEARMNPIRPAGEVATRSAN